MGTPLLTASIPVYVPAPIVYAFTIKKSIPNIPNSFEDEAMSEEVEVTRLPNWKRCTANE